MTANSFTITVSVDPVEPPIEPPIEPPVEPPEPPAGGGLAATYVVPSGPHAGTYVFSETGGLGQTRHGLEDYLDPDGAFIMSCVAVTREDAPLQVIFRRVDGWSCIIFECCDVLATTNQHMMPDSGGANTIVISEDGTTIETVSMWGQWALGRWRWQSGAWPFPKDPAVLREKKWLPLFDGTALQATAPGVPARVEYVHMHIPKGYPLYVGGGGNPTMLSPVQGYWGAHPNADSLANMLRQAEGLHAYPWFIRASDTWGVPNIWQGTHATRTKWMPNTAYSIFGVTVTGTPGTVVGYDTVTDDKGKAWSYTYQPYCILDAAGKGNFDIQNTGYPGASEPSGPLTTTNAAVTSIEKRAGTFMQGSGMVIDEPHSGSMWVHPWIATGDPYYLEAMHSKYVMVWMGIGRAVPRAKLGYSQIRQTAWQLTSLLINTATTPATTPSWLLPKSLWETLWADEMRLWDQELVHGTSGGATIFHTVGATAGGAQAGYQLAPWQEDMILQVMSWATMLLPDSKRCAEWKVQDQIQRLNGASGWCQWYPETYYMDIGPMDRSRFYADWGECWAQNQLAKKVAGPPDPVSLAGCSPDYCNNLRGGLALASQAGVAGAAEALAWLTAAMKAQNWGDNWHRLWAD